MTAARTPVYSAFAALLAWCVPVAAEEVSLHGFVQGNYAARITGQELSDRKSTRLNSSHIQKSRMPSSA